MKALEQLGLAGKVKLVGFDYTNEIHQALEEKKIHDVIVQRPYQVGYLGVSTACDAIEGKPVKKRIVTEKAVISDVDDIYTVQIP